MEKLQQSILKTFLKNPEHHFSTDEVIKRIYPDEYERIRNYTDNISADPELEKLGKRRKAKLQRKIIYHLNILTKQSFLIISKIEAKGKKYFSLNPERRLQTPKDEQIRRIFESFQSQSQPRPTGLETYEEQKLIKRYDSNSWKTKINSLIIEHEKIKDANELYKVLADVYMCYNDVLGINDFQYYLDRHTPQEIIDFLRKINHDSSDYNKYINLLINLDEVKDEDKFQEYIHLHAQLNPDKVFVIFKLTKKTLITKNRSLKTIIQNFSKNKIRINIHNKDLYPAPYMIGRAGAYTWKLQEWKRYETDIKGKTIGLACGESTIYVDLKKFFKKHNLVEFRTFCEKASKSFVITTSAVKQRSDVYFRAINIMNKKHENKFFSLTHNNIRLWNYTYEDPRKKYSPEEFFEVLRIISEEMEAYSKKQEDIYRSCGLPIRFRAFLSTAFRRFDKEFLSERQYEKIIITTKKDFMTKEASEKLRRRESLYAIFKGGDRVRFYRSMDFHPDEIIDEFNHLLSNYNIPLLTYDFRDISKNITLSTYIK